MKKNKHLLLAGILAVIAGVGLVSGSFNPYVNTRYNDTHVDNLRVGGQVSYGDADLTAGITLPTSTNAMYQDLLPVYNPTGTTIAAGSVLISSNISTNTGAWVNIAPATIDLTNIIGVAAEAIAGTSNGFMVPRAGKYVLVLTTGTVARGDLLVTSGTVAGYLGVDATPTTGADIAVALRPSTDGNLLLALIR